MREQRSRSGGSAVGAGGRGERRPPRRYASDEDLQAARQTAGVVGGILAGRIAGHGWTPPPGRRLLEAGCRVAVATDCNPGTCYSESMPLMISLAVALGRLSHRPRHLVAATAGGAAALGLGDRGCASRRIALVTR